MTKDYTSGKINKNIPQINANQYSCLSNSIAQL